MAKCVDQENKNKHGNTTTIAYMKRAFEMGEKTYEGHNK